MKTGRLPGQSPNIHLNAEGQAQAAALGHFLRTRKLSAIYSSHLERAIETAWRIAAHQGLSITVRPDLADTHTGEFTGKLVKELAESPDTKDIWKIIVEQPSQGVLPGGESLLDMQCRVVAALDRICAEHPDPQPEEKDRITEGSHEPAPHPGEGKPADPPPPPLPPQIIAVVMHADPIKAALAHYLGIPFDNFQRLVVSPASVSAAIIALDAQSPMRVSILNVNQTVPIADAPTR